MLRPRGIGSAEFQRRRGVPRFSTTDGGSLASTGNDLLNLGSALMAQGEAEKRQERAVKDGRASLEFDKDLDVATLKNPVDVESFDKDSQVARSRVLARTPEDRREEVALSLDRSIQQRRRQIAANGIQHQMASSLARAKVNIQGSLGEAALQFQRDSAGFTERVAAVREKLIEGTPEQLRPQIEGFFDVEAQRLRLSIAGSEQSALNQSANADIFTMVSDAESRMADAAREGDRDRLTGETEAFESGLDQLVRSGAITGQQRAAMSETAREARENNAVLGQFERTVDAGGIESGTRFVESVLEGDQFVAPTRDRIGALLVRRLDAMQKGAAAVDAERDAQIDLQQRHQISELEIRIDRGQADYDDIQKAEEQGLFDTRPAVRTRLNKALDDSYQKRVDEAHLLSLGAAAASGETALDPSNKDHRKAVEAHFKTNILPKFAQDPNAAASEAVRAASASGIVPEGMRGLVRSGLRSSDASAAVNAADMVARIADQPNGSRLLADFSASDREFAARISGFVEDGVEPARAIELAREAEAPQNDGVRMFRENLYDEGIADDVPGLVEDAMNGPEFGDKAHIPSDEGSPLRQAIVGDYENVYRAEYMKTGSQAVAKQAADRAIKSIWGPTRIDEKSATFSSGARAMRYPPEMFYAVSGRENDWMQKQLIADLRKRGIWHRGIPDMKVGDEPRKPSTLDEFQLFSDSRTAREAGHDGRPSYLIMQERDGAWLRLLDDDGQPSRWRPDRNAEIEAKAAEDEANIEAMRAEIEAYGRVYEGRSFLGRVLGKERN